MIGRQISLREFARFAGEYEAVLVALFRRADESLSREDLMRIAADHGDGKTPSHIVDCLIEYRMVEEADIQSGLFRYAAPLAELHRHLAKQGEPVSAESIAANLAALNHVVTDMDIARAAGNASKARLAADDLRLLCSQIMRGVVQNHRHIQREALVIKGSEGSMPLRVRYERLQHAWERYIEPLVRMVEIRGEFSSRTSEAERALIAAEREGLLTDAEEVRRSRLLLASATATAVRAVTDCVKTVQPILSELRADSRVVAGAALGMAAFIRTGAVRSGLAALLRHVHVREQERFRDEHARDILATLLDFKPTEPDPTPPASQGVAEGVDIEFIPFLQSAVAGLRVAGHVPDVLAFMRKRHPEAPSHHMLRLYHELLDLDGIGPRAVLGPREEYALPGCDLSSPRLTLLPETP